MGRKRKRLGGMTHQTLRAMQTIHVTNVSPRELAEQGLLDKRIWSIGTMRDYCQASIGFTKWCRAQHGVRDVRKVTPAMASEYLEVLRDQELADGTLGRVRAALAKLDASLRERGDWSRGRPPLVTGDGANESPADRAYTPEAAAQIITDLEEHADDKQVALVAMLNRMAGLSAHEVVNLRAEDIDVEACGIRLREGDGVGIGRTVRVTSECRGFLQLLRERAEENRDGHVFQGRQSLVKRVRREVAKACDRLGQWRYGTMGLRRLWARERYESLRSRGLDAWFARQRVADDMGYRRVEDVALYVLRESV